MFETDEENEDNQNEDTLYVGIVGFSQQNFNQEDAREAIEDILDDIEDEYMNDFDEIAIVSRLTNMGIAKIAYQIADDRDYETIGLAPLEAQEYPQYDVDEIIWKGEHFGDESDYFIDYIDVFVRIGGGTKSHIEQELAEEDDLGIYEYDFD